MQLIRSMVWLALTAAALCAQHVAALQPAADRRDVGNALESAILTRDRAVLRHILVAAATFGLQARIARRRLNELAAGEDRELGAIAAATLKRLPAK